MYRMQSSNGIVHDDLSTQKPRVAALLQGCIGKHGLLLSASEPKPFSSDKSQQPY